MATRKIHAGEVVEISPVYQVTMDKPYSGKVEMVSDTCILVHWPLENRKYVRLPATEVYWLQSQKAMCRYKAIINTCTTKDGFKLIEFKLIDKGESLQQRDHYRLECHIPITFRLHSQQPSGTIDDCGPFQGSTINLSGGGLKITSKIDMEENTLLTVRITLDGHEMRIMGEVRAKYNDRSAPNRFQYGVMFSDVKEVDQKRIIHYIYMQQKQRIKTREAASLAAQS